MNVTTSNCLRQMWVKHIRESPSASHALSMMRKSAWNEPGDKPLSPQRSCLTHAVIIQFCFITKQMGVQPGCKSFSNQCIEFIRRSSCCQLCLHLLKTSINRWTSSHTAHAQWSRGKAKTGPLWPSSTSATHCLKSLAKKGRRNDG